MRRTPVFADQPIDNRGGAPLTPGCGYVLDGRLVRLLRLNGSSAFVADAATLEEFETKPELLRVVPQKKSGPRRLDAVPTDEYTRAEKLRDRIQEVLVLPVASRTDEKIAEFAEPFGISARRFRELITAWLGAPEISTLVRQQRGPKFGSKRCSPNVESVLSQVVQYAQSAKEVITLESCRDQFEKLAAPISRKLNKAVVAPCDKVFRDRLARAGIVLSQRRRHGPSKSKEIENPHTGTYEVDRPLRRIEIDHTRADVMVLDDEKGTCIGRPWLTLVLDCAPRVILGWYVSFDPPSIESVCQALICAVTPKNDRLKELGIGHLDFPYWGKPEYIYTDNASEFRCEATIRGCEQNNIKIDFRPLGKKHFGGRIERIIGTMMGKCHLLVGTTFNNPKLRDSYDSEAKATLTLKEFEGWLVSQMHAYHHSIHSALERTPHQEWIHAFTKSQGQYIPPPLLEDIDAFRFHFLKRMLKPLWPSGIRFDKRWYSSSALFNLFSVKEKVWIYIDYVNPNVIRVQDAHGVIHTIGTNQPDALSYSARRARRRALRRQGKSSQALEQRALGKATAAGIVDKAKKRKRRRFSQETPPNKSVEKTGSAAHEFRIPRIKY